MTGKATRRRTVSYAPWGPLPECMLARSQEVMNFSSVIFLECLFRLSFLATPAAVLPAQSTNFLTDSSLNFVEHTILP